MRAKRGQAFLETVIAVVFLIALFLTLFQISHLVQSRILLDHAAARAARARAVGFNEFMCLKSARVAMIPIAGKQLLDIPDGYSEVSKVPIYLSSESFERANAILDYEHWHTTDISVSSGDGIGSSAVSDILMVTDELRMDGKSEVESHYPLYMFNQGR